MDITYIIAGIFLVAALFCNFSGSRFARPLAIAAVICAGLTWVFLPLGYVLLGAAVMVALLAGLLKKFSGPMF